MKKKEEPTERKEAETENKKPRKLTEKELEKVTGGEPITLHPLVTGQSDSETDTSCPKKYTECTRENCMNPYCPYLSRRRDRYNYVYRCSQLVGSFEEEIDLYEATLNPGFKFK